MLRFAIIKTVRTRVGKLLEDVVYEHEEDRVFGDLKENMRTTLLEDKNKPRFGERKWTEEEINEAFEKAWYKTITAFKKVTITIL